MWRGRFRAALLLAVYDEVHGGPERFADLTRVYVAAVRAAPPAREGGLAPSDVPAECHAALAYLDAAGYVRRHEWSAVGLTLEGVDVAERLMRPPGHAPTE